MSRFNVAEFLTEAATRWGEAPALHDQGRTWTFTQLLAYSNGYASQLSLLGLEPGHRILMLVKNSAEFVALTFAVFRLGCVPVLIDPGMGLRGLLRCIGDLRPDAVVGIPKGLLLSRLFPRAFSQVRVRACLGRFPGTPRLTLQPFGEFPAYPSQGTDLAAILFTSGSTGPAKGVLYRHEIFKAQVEHLQALYQFEPGEVDLPGFPLFALFSTAMGIACVIPPLDPSRPAQVDPAKMVAAIHRYGVTSLQGSPAIWRRVAAYCLERSIELPTVKRLLTFGAPIELEFLEDWSKILDPAAGIYTPYGATEALPVASITGSQALATRDARLAGAGICVGQPVVEVRIVPITDEPLEEASSVPQGQVGEVAVRGTVATWGYYRKPEADLRSKIGSAPDLWHRMGDMGYLDADGMLWLMGRKSHRVVVGSELFCPLAVEGMVNSHPSVRRSALVGVGQEPVLVVERAGGTGDLTPELLELLAPHPLYCRIRTVLYHKSFPVDPRHNAKIHREQLAEWAASRPLGAGPAPDLESRPVPHRSS